MIVSWTKFAGMGLLLLCLASQAAAEEPTRYEYYLVMGDSPRSLFASMLSNGPQVAGGRAYASARMDRHIETRTERTRHQCRVATLKINMTFTIHLPQLNPEQTIAPSLRRSFERFYAFAKHHEETHRAIWLQCAAEAEIVARGVAAATCAEAEARSLEIVESVGKRCDRRHAAFDAAEQKLLKQHPFIRQLRSTSPTETAAN
jgi:predicted secreted Zn-dependent protease